MRRRSLKLKLLRLLDTDEHELDIKHLWPKDTENVNQELKELIDRRDEYTHQGKIENTKVSGQDMSRLRYLISMWILKLLEYPLDQLNDYDEDLWYAQRKY